MKVNFKSALTITSLVAVMALGATAALAQDAPPGAGPGQVGRGPGGGRGGMMRGGVGMIRMPEVQAELKLSADQKAKISQLLEENRPAPPEPGQRPDPAEMKAMNDKVMAGLKQILSDGQLVRFHQIELQMAGANGIDRPEVAKALGLSQEQLDQIREIKQASRPQPGAPRPTREAMMARRKEMEAKVMAVLTEGQRAKYKAMLGAPFKMPQRGRPGGGGGGQ